jgi:autotransporter-associated beta strand protein
MQFASRTLPSLKVTAVALSVLMTSAVTSAIDLRIATYNIDADTGGTVGQIGGPDGGPGLIPVLEAIGAIHLGDGVAQPIDVLALEEMNTPSTTAAYIVGQLNSYYQSIGVSASYAYDPNVDPSTGGTGGGPSGLIYNTNTVQDLGATFLAYGGSGAPRAPARYTLQPVGGSSTFYLYVSHMKSGGDSSSVNRRNVEAQEIRADAGTLGTGANIIYAGDFNGSPGEAYYTTLTASGTGQAFDPGYPTNLLTESATSLTYRDDYQFSTAPVYSGTSNFRLVSSSYTVFGNNGSTSNTGSVNQMGNTALNDLGSNKSTILADLTTATDHLPIVADYSLTSAGTLGVIAVGNALSATIITGGTGTLGFTVTNAAPAGYGNVNCSVSAAPAQTGTQMILGSAAPGAGTLTPGASQAFTFPVTSTNTSVNPFIVDLTASDPNSANISASTTASLTVLRHSWPAVVVGSGNNQRVIQGAAGITAGLVLYNAPGPGYAKLDVNSLGAGVSGPIGGELVSSGSTLAYTAALSTGTVGVENQVFSLNVGDDHTLPGALAPTNTSTTVTLTVLGHAAPLLSVTGGNNQQVIQGATGITAALVLGNGTVGQSGLAALDVNSLGTGLSGPTGGSLVGSGSTRAYTATLNTGTLGVQNQVFSVNAGDDHTLPGASAATNVSTTATLTVLDHALGSAAVTAGNGFLVRAGATGLTATISVSDAAGGRSSLQIGAAPTIGGGSLSSGPTVPYLVSPGSAQSYTATFGVGNMAGAFSDTISFPSAGDNQSLPGASVPGSLSVSITGNVYSGNAVWTGTAASWATANNWRDAGGGPTNAPGGDGIFGHDTATFANSGAATAIDLTGADPNLQALAFSSSDYTLSNGSLTLQSSAGTATVMVNSNKQAIAASTVLTLASSAEVAVATGAELDINAGISEVGGHQSLQKDGGGTLVLSGTNMLDGGTYVAGGTLIVDNSAALADRSDITVGSASMFSADPPLGSSLSVTSVPEPRTVALLAIGAALLAARAARRRSIYQASRWISSHA